MSHWFRCADGSFINLDKVATVVAASDSIPGGATLYYDGGATTGIIAADWNLLSHQLSVLADNTEADLIWPGK